MSRTRNSLAVLLLAAGGVLGTAVSAPAHVPDPETFIFSNESYARFLHASPQERQLIEDDPDYREAWLSCLPPGRVEPNIWGHGYVCIPEGAVQ
ncbi:hypothetical protein ACIQM4_28830 [Streptomyces sp. NPDC091272]|uniref:hypothetical protein n=1 Tax=Streptomyces sp. NPDC091272 TaxID=3365981 RepID=UPI003819DADD